MTGDWSLRFAKEPDDAPMRSNTVTIEQFLRSGPLRAANVQRKFVWKVADLDRLIDDVSGFFDIDLREAEFSAGPELVEEDAPEDPQEDAPRDAGDVEATAAPVAQGDADVSGGSFVEAEAPPPTVLYNDAPPVESAAADAYFLGTYIVEVVAQDGAPHTLYDGLQRTTSLCLLLAVARDMLAAVDPDFAERLHRLLTPDEAPVLSIYDRLSDLTLARQVFPEGAVRLKRDSRGLKGGALSIMAVKNHLVRKFEKFDGDPSAVQLRTFCEKLLTQTWITVLAPQAPSLARQAFVTTNLYGAPLEPIDVFKGQLIDLAQSEAEAEACYALWQRVSSEREFPTVLRAVDFIERRTWQLEQWPTELGVHLEARLQPGQALAWLTLLESRVQMWRAFMTVLRRGGPTPLEQNIFRLSVFTISDKAKSGDVERDLPVFRSAAPLLLYWWELLHRRRASGETTEQAEHFFAAIHKRCVTFLLQEVDQKLVGALIAKALEASEASVAAGAPIAPTAPGEPLGPGGASKRKIEKTLGRAFEDHRHKPLNVLLKWLETERWRDDLPRLIEKGNVEHILSRGLPATSTSRDAFDTEADFEHASKMIGNTAFMDAKDNEALENKEPLAKFDVYRKWQSEYDTLRGVARHKKWGKREINRRTMRLKRRIVEALDLI